MNVRLLSVALVALVFGVAAYFLLGKRAPQTAAPVSGPFRIFVSNYNANTISVVEGEPERETKTIPVGRSPQGLAVRIAEPLLAVANSTGYDVTLIDPVSLAVLGKVDVGAAPEDLAFSIDGKMLFVTSPLDKTINFVDVEQRKQVGDPVVFSNKPRRVIPAPDGKRLYVLVDGAAGTVAAIDLQTRQITAMAQVGRNPLDFGLSGDGRSLVAASFDESTATVVDTETFQPVSTWDVETGNGLVVHPKRSVAYSMASFDDDVWVLNFENGNVEGPFTFGEWPSYGTITKDGRFLYIPHEDSNSLVKMDTTTNQQVLRIAVGKRPMDAEIFDTR